MFYVSAFIRKGFICVNKNKITYRRSKKNEVRITGQKENVMVVLSLQGFVLKGFTFEEAGLYLLAFEEADRYHYKEIDA